jgi:UPF0042 nucleotide-binding protein
LTARHEVLRCRYHDIFFSADMSAQRGFDIVIVTGASGAGRSTAINALEDFGFEAIDNLPLSLFPRLVSRHAPLDRQMVVGIDPRNRDFSSQKVLDIVAELRAMDGVEPHLVFMDCAADVLFKRFSETRRRHPLAPHETVRKGVMRELTLLQTLKDRADIVYDTSHMAPQELRGALARLFDTAEKGGMAVQVQSFSYKRGLPRSADMVMDVRFLRNPHWEPELRPLDGREEAVAAYVREDANYSPFIDHLTGMLELLLPAYKNEGKSYFSIGLGCTGGQHRSVSVAETLAIRLAEIGWRVSIRHRELELSGSVPVRDLG